MPRGWCALWLCAAGAVAAEEAPTAYAARVTRVFDGDTIWVQPLDGGARRKLRLDGIDAPEICQRDGPQARDALASRIRRQVVQVEVHAHDAYGRGLARLVHQGDDVNAWLVQRGWAWAYRWRSGEGPYAALEARARDEGLGLFAQAGAQPPGEFRRTHGPCDRPAPRPSAVR